MQANHSDSAVSAMRFGAVATAESGANAGCDDLIERAFQLAYFLVQDRTAAIDVVGRARGRLSAEESREKKRIYWRTSSSKQKIRRMIRAEQDALQWLIYLESEKYESQQEQNERPPVRALGVRYIKSIVQMTGNMSCFYVAVGLHRILHNYSTPNVQAAYEWLTEDFAGTEKYRRVKRKLMQKLADRFCGCITIRQAENQELRFDVDENQDGWLPLVTDCLQMFTPWSTRDGCLLRADCNSALLGPSLGAASRRSRVDVGEMKRCHIFIHPPCFDQLASRLSLDPRSAKLAMPRFTMSENSENKLWQITGNAPPLTAEERAALTRQPEDGHTQDGRELLESLSILADGAACARLELCHGSRTQWKIAEGTRLIEFGAEGETGITVLARHWVAYTIQMELPPANTPSRWGAAKN